MDYLYLEFNESMFCTSDTHLRNLRSVSCKKMILRADAKIITYIALLLVGYVKRVITVWWARWQCDISFC